MKKLIFLCGALLLATSVFAQSDDDLFGGSDDDFFADDSIVEVDDVSAKTDLSKGVIFDSGTVKVGGSLTASIGTNTILYSPDSTDFGENLKNTTLKPELSALLSVDARPSQNLRMYTKFGFAYPFKTNAITYLDPNSSMTNLQFVTSVSDWFKLKELFTDFSIKETAFFRFGIHTVTWGTGYFFSPVSDMINTSSIDPENPELQVDGALNLRTQIVFPDSQNCLWLYVIPSTDFAGQTAETYLRDTAFAAKADVLLGNCELGVGAFYKYQNAPKVMLTATGSLKKVSFFGEVVYSYGSSTEWTKNTDWDDKSNIFQATAGLNYYWKEPMISLAAQYYFNGNTKDLEGYVIGGHNIAAMVGFGKVFGTKDFSASLFAMANFGREEFTDEALAGMKMAGVDDATIAAFSGTSLTTTAMLFYSPINELKVGMGPSLTFKSFDKNPTISLKLSATLGGGNF